MRKLFISLSLLVVGIFIFIFALVIALLAVLLVVVADQEMQDGTQDVMQRTTEGSESLRNYSRSRKSMTLDAARRISRKQVKAR